MQCNNNFSEGIIRETEGERGRGLNSYFLCSSYYANKYICVYIDQ